MRFSLKTLLLLVGVSALAVVAAAAFFRSARESGLREIFGGSSGVGVLQNADRVQAFLLEDLPIEPNRQCPLSAYPKRLGPVEISGSDAKQIKATLLNQESYEFDIAKACIFQPGVRLDFIDGNSTLQVLLCFECDTLQTFINGQLVGGEDFDYARAELVRAVRAIFPDEPLIKSLAESP